MRLIRLLKQDLKQEIRLWVEKRLISTEQAVSLCQLYGMNYHEHNRGYAYSVLLILGYLFIGLAVITLLSANWEDISRELRMGGLLLTTLIVNLAALLSYQRRQTNAAVGLFFLGSLLYGASIMLIAQIYHLGEHFPDGILWWALGVLPLAVLLQSASLMLLTIGLSFTWFFVETDLHFYPLLFPLFLLAMGHFLYQSRTYYSIFIAFIVGITLWLEYSLGWWLNHGYGFRFEIEHVLFSIGLSLLYHALTQFLAQQASPWSDYAVMLSLWGLRFSLLFLLIFSFKEPWHELLAAPWSQPVALFGLAVVLSVISVILSYIGDKKSHSTLLWAIIYLAFFAWLLLAQGDHRTNHAGIDDPQLLQILDNITLIALGIWLIIRGLQNNISHYFFLGILSIMLTGLLRYIHFIGDYIGATLLFMVFAVILLSAAKYWHWQQKRVTQ